MTKKPNAGKSPRARKYSREALRNISKIARKNPSLYAEIARRMQERTKQPFYRQEVSAWLKTLEGERIEPRLGAGLLLLKVANEVITENESQKCACSALSD
jgi:hypothetical protein